MWMVAIFHGDEARLAGYVDEGRIARAGGRTT